MTTPGPSISQPLQRQFLRAIAIGGTAALVLLCLLAWIDYGRAYQQVLDQHVIAARNRQAGVAQLAASIHGQIAVMQNLVATRIADPRSPYTGALPTLDAGTNPGPAGGGLFMPVRDTPPPPGTLTALAAAQELFGVQRAFHAGQPALQWSYVFGGDRDFVSVYPWTPLMGPPGPRQQAIFESYFGYDIYLMATPERNPEHLAYWTPAYVDAAGSGLMVSHGAPIYLGNRLRALVGADVLLSSIGDYLGSFSQVSGRFLLVDQHKNVIADSARPDLAMLPLGNVTAAIGEIPKLEPWIFTRLGNLEVMICAIPGTPWQLIHAVPVTLVATAALASVTPYLTLAVGVLASLVVLYLIVSARFIRPALRIANYVETVSGHPDQPFPVVPAAWQPWMERVKQTSQTQRDLIVQLQGAEALKGAVIDAVLDAVIIADGDGRVIGFNTGAEKLFGYTAADAVGQRISDLIVPPQSRDAHDRGFRRFRETGVGRVLGRPLELTAMRADKSTFLAEVAIHHVVVDGRDIFAAYAHDLTFERQARSEIERQQQRIYQIEKLSAMGSLLAGVAHELNNPLAILVAQSTLLKEKATTPDVERRAERIHAAASRAGRIVKSFLAMARQNEPERAAVQLNDIVDAALEVIGYGLRSAGIELTRALDADLPVIDADRDLIGQVVANLIINAQQALAERDGVRRVAVSTERRGRFAILTVEDNGPGVPPAIAERIYEPYFTTKAVGVGTGIGLSISRSIVDAHGGRISLHAGAEGGARFEVELPLSNVIEGAAVEAQRASAGGRSVLIVDDEPDVATSLSEILELDGYHASVVDGPLSALKRIETTPFDFVFADLRMPGMDGRTLRRRIAELDSGLAARTIIMTGDVVLGPEALREGEPGNLQVLEKPFTIADVRAALAATADPSKLALV
jgi:PAS domain S-box-containing protein